MIDSLELYDYDRGIDNPNWVDYKDEFVTLLEHEKTFAGHRKRLVELQAELEQTDESGQKVTLELEVGRVNGDIVLLAQTRLSQQEMVDMKLRALVGDATATIVWTERINDLRTPSATPIIIPTATLGS
jgi:hypothetical protein